MVVLYGLILAHLSWKKLGNSKNDVDAPTWIWNGVLYPNPMYYEKSLTTVHIPPEGFLYLQLDQKGFIQDHKNVPL